MSKKHLKPWENGTAFQTREIDGVNSIGVIAVYDLAEIKVSREDARNQLELMGFDPSVLKPKCDKSAFKTALQSLEDCGILVQVDKTYQWVTYQTNVTAFRQAMSDGGLPNVDISPKAVIRYYKEKRSPKGGTIESDQYGLADAVKSLMDIERDLARTTDIYHALRETMKRIGDCVRMRQNGGADFIPADFYESAVKLQEFVMGLPGYSTFTLVPVPAANTATIRNVWRSIGNEVEAELRALDRAADSISKKMDEAEVDGSDEKKDKDFSKAIGSAHNRFQSTIERAQLYADFLGVQAEKMLERISEKQAQFMMKVGTL